MLVRDVTFNVILEHPQDAIGTTILWTLSVVLRTLSRVTKFKMWSVEWLFNVILEP
jgi:hypothetical protein